MSHARLNLQRTFDADGRRGANHVNFRLKQSGEALGVFSPSGLMLDGINYGPQSMGGSPGRLPDGGEQIVSFTKSTSPEESNYLPISSVVVNELLTHADAPLEDAIEPYNSSPGPVDIGGWYLSNSKQLLKKY